MKLAGTNLKNFLAIMETTGRPDNVMVADLYTIVTGSGRMVLNQPRTPGSLSITTVPPTDGLGITGAFLQDMGAREANGDCLARVASGPSAGQYAVNDGSGVYSFSDNNPKLISYMYRIGQTYGRPVPIILRYCSLDQNIPVFGQIFYSAGTINNLSSPAPAIQRSKTRLTVGMEVASMDIELFADPTNQVNNLPVLQQIASGFFDGASVYVQRLIMRGYQVSVNNILEDGLITVFMGTVAEQTPGRTKAKLTVKSRTEVLDTKMPRNLYQTGCRWTLFDTGCTLNPAASLDTGTVQSASTFSVIQTNLTKAGPLAAPASAPVLSDTGASNLTLAPTKYWAVITYVSALGETTPSPEASWSVPRDRLLHVAAPSSPPAGATAYNVYAGFGPGDWRKQNGSPISIGSAWTENGNGLVTGSSAPPVANTGGWYDLGVITFTTGALAGQSRVVMQYLADKSVTVVPALSVAPSAGDTFSILPGCDKQMSTCLGKFNNLINFGGTPFVPNPETAI